MLMLRIIAGHLLVLHTCTAWAWLILYRYLLTLKPDILKEHEWDASIGIPLLMLYMGLWVAMMIFVVFGGVLTTTNNRSSSYPMDGV